MIKEKTIVLDGNSLKLEDVVSVARNNVKVSIAPGSEQAVNDSRKIIDKIVEDKRVVYGVNTGFGSLCNVSISQEDTAQLQENYS